MTILLSKWTDKLYNRLLIFLEDGTPLIWVMNTSSVENTVSWDRMNGRVFVGELDYCLIQTKNPLSAE